MNKKMQLILDIMQLGVEISKTTKADVFVSYSGHVDLFNVRAFKNGWGNRLDGGYERDIYLNVDGDYRTEEDIIETLSEIYAELVNI